MLLPALKAPHPTLELHTVQLEDVLGFLAYDTHRRIATTRASMRLKPKFSKRSVRLRDRGRTNVG